tara:strand:- start:271 stop:543 length:273 start_codon:yes stop_codon:yes gene_type:complete
MKKIILLATVLTFFVGAESLMPNKSEAGTTCKYDFFGNYVCTGTGNDFGFNSTTKKDFFGNDNTTYKNYNTGQSGSFSCKTDFFGNYVCN